MVILMSDTESIIKTYVNGIVEGIFVVWIVVSTLSKLAFIVVSMMWPILAGLVHLPMDATFGEFAPFIALQVAWPVLVWFPVAKLLHQYGYSEYFMLVVEDE